MPRNRIRAWFSQTHNAQFELVRHFLTQIDLVSSDQVQRWIITMLAALACVEPLILRLYIPKYGYLRSLDTSSLYLAEVHADRLFFISLSMIAGAATAIAQWQGLFPSRLDYLALKPLPIRLHQVFAARFLSSFIMATIVIVDLNLAANVLFPLLTSGKWQFPSFGMQYVFAHATATIAAGLSMFLAVTALQGVVMNLFPPRAFERVSVLMQAVLGTALVAAVPYVFDIPNWFEKIAAQPRWMVWFPPVWFLGLYETLLGSQDLDLYFRHVAGLAVKAIAVSLSLVLVAYFFSYRRYARRILEQVMPRAHRSRVDSTVSGLAARFVQNSRTQAAFGFAICTLRRSRHHKLVTGFFFALALLFALQASGPSVKAHFVSGQSWTPGQLESILGVPLVIGAVMISALCYVFQLPSEVRANWVFRMAENSGRRELLDSVESLLVVGGVVPALLLAAPLETFALRPAAVLFHLIFVAVLMLLLIELRLNEWHKIPFTCSYLSGRRNFWQILGAYLFLFGVMIPAITHLEARLLRPLALLLISVVLSLVYLTLRARRRRHWKLVPLIFEESGDALISAIRIAGE